MTMSRTATAAALDQPEWMNQTHRIGYAGESPNETGPFEIIRSPSENSGTITGAGGRSGQGSPTNATVGPLTGQDEVQASTQASATEAEQTASPVLAVRFAHKEATAPTRSVPVSRTPTLQSQLRAERPDRSV